MPVRAKVRIPPLATAADLRDALEALTVFNAAWLARRPSFPRLMSSGVRYRREYPREEWLSAPEVERRGVGDCEDLAAWMAAELRLGRGDVGGIARPVMARAVPERQRSGNWHIVVRTPSGRRIDPSKMLGM
ncbi:MAG: hypothetical protein GY953_46975 [bacterium]|nr:hypothetical protein [bacterium]